MTELFVREIREGIGDTGVRAGILKCATDTAGHHPGRRAGAAGRGPGPPPDRDPDHHPYAHPSPAVGARAAADPGRGGRRPHPGGHRPFGWDPRHRVPRGHHGQRLVPGLRPLRHRDLLPGRAHRSRSRSSATGAMPTGSSSPTTPCATSTGSRPRWPSAWNDWRWTHIPEDVLPRDAALGHQRGGHLHDDGRQPPPHPRRV